MFDLVMFDLDGTLVDTAGDIADSVNDVLGAMSLPPVTDGQVRGWIGSGSRELLIRAWSHAAGLAPEAARASEQLEPLLKRYDARYQLRCGGRSRTYPRVHETLAELRRCGVALALVSNRERLLADAVLRRHDLGHYFDPVVTGDTLPVRKPDPRMIGHCLELRGVAPERALMVGDSAIDVAAARNAGVRCWTVPYGYGAIPVAQAGPDRIIADISAVLAVN